MLPVPFPRGGNTDSALGDSKKSNTATAVDNDALFGTKRTRVVFEGPGKKGDKKKKLKSMEDASSAKTDNPEDAARANLGLGMLKTNANQKAVKIDNLTFAKYSPGVVAFGYVLQLNDNNAVISLPGGVTGTVALNEVSDVCSNLLGPNKNEGTELPVMSRMLSLFQPITCVVLGVSERNTGATVKKSLSLSLRASLIHRSLTLLHLLPGFPMLGCIASKEDHGYLVSCGMSGVIFFLPFKAVPESIGRDLPIGMPIDCVVESVNETARSVTLRAHVKAVQEAVVKSSKLSFLALRSGMLVNAVVEKVIQNGLIVNFMGLFHGVIDSFNLPRPVSSPGEIPLLSAGTVQLARIVYINHATKSVRLSLKVHVVELRGPRHLPERGSLLSDISVIAADKKVGVLLGNREALVTAAGDDSTDKDEIEQAEDDGKPLNKKQRAEILLRQRERNEAIVGVFIHRSSLAAIPSEDSNQESSSAPGRDTPIASDKIEKVYRPGTLTHARVIGYHLVEGWAVASNLRSYMHSEVVHASQLYAGQVVDTEVAAVRDFGLIVLVGGKIRAVCPGMHLTEAGIVGGTSASTAKAIAKKFKVGQKMKMRVWEANGDGFVLTCKKSLVEDTECPVIADYSDAVEGSIAKGVVSKVTEEGLKIHFFNKVMGTVPVSVLVQQGVHDIESAFRQGQVVSCIILGKTMPKEYKGKGPAKAKPRLTLGLDLGDMSTSKIKELRDSLNLPNAAQDSTADGKADPEVHNVANSYEFVSGTIIREDDTDFFVQLDQDPRAMGKLMKLHVADSAAVAGRLVSLGKYKVGQRIDTALVLSTTTNKNGSKIVQLSMKPLLLQVARSHLSKAASDDRKNVTKKKMISEQLAAISDGGAEISIPTKASELSPGQIIAGVIWKVESYGVLIKFRDNFTVLVPRTNLADRFVPTPVGLFEVGDSVRCAVQRVDYARDRVIATFKSAFVPQSSGAQCYLKTRLEEEFAVATLESLSTEAQLQNCEFVSMGSVVTASVVSVKPYGLVLQLPKVPGNTMMLARGDGDELNSRYARGQAVDVCVLDIDLKNKVFDVTIDSEVLALVQKAASSSKKSKSKKSKGANEPEALMQGQFVKGTVLLLKEHYIVVLTNTGAVGYAMVADYHCPTRNASEFTVGQQVTLRAEILGSSADIDGACPFNSSAFFTLQSSFDATSTLNTGVSVLAHRVQHEAEQADEQMHSKLSKSTPIEILAGTNPELAKQKFFERLRLGAIMKWEISQVSSLEMQVVPDGLQHIGLKVKASVHITGTLGSMSDSDKLNELIEEIAAVADSIPKKKKSSKKESNKALVDHAIADTHPFCAFKVGDKVTCKVAQVRREESSAEDHQMMIYLTLHDPASDFSLHRNRRMVQWKGRDGVKENVIYPSVIVNVEPSGVIVALSPYVSARMSYIDIAHDPVFLQKVKSYCGVGMSMLVCVMRVYTEGNGNKSAIDLSRLVVEQCVQNGGSVSSHIQGAANLRPISFDLPPLPKRGQLVTGMLNLQPRKVKNPPAFLLHMAYNRMARICITELMDPEDWTDLGTFFSAAKKEQGSKVSATAGGEDAAPQVQNFNQRNRLDSVEQEPAVLEPCNGSIVSARILSVKTMEDGTVQMEASLRSSRINAKKKSVALVQDAIPSVGELVNGYVVSTTGKGCFVRLSKDLTAQIQVKNLSDDFIKNPGVAFPPGRLIRNAKVMEVVGEENGENISSMHVHLSLKSSDTGRIPETEAAQLEQLEKGLVVTGKVQSIASCGVFVAIDGTTLVGLSRPPVAIAGGSSADLAKLSSTFEIGEPVRALVLGISGRKISLGLKPSLFEKGISDDESENSDTMVDDDESGNDESEQAELEDEEAMSVDDNKEDGEDGGASGYDSDDNEEEGGVQYVDPVDSEDDDEMDAMIKAAALHSDDDDDDDSDHLVEPSISKEKISKKRSRDENVTTMPNKRGSAVERKAEESDQESDDLNNDKNVPSSIFSKSHNSNDDNGFLQWDDFKPAATDATTNQHVSDNEDSEEDEDFIDEAGGGGRKTRLKAQEKRVAEEKLRAKEATLLRDNAEATSADDFERKLLAEPNSSFYWVQYMAMHLMAADIESARRVAIRALRTINFREEDEKYNVWVAYVNLEHKYGTMASLDEVFKKAVSESKGKYLHLHLAQVYESNNDLTGAEALYEIALKKYKKSKKVWMAYQDFKLRNGDATKAKSLLQRSLQSLSRHKHIPVLLHYCQSEYDFGSVDRGRVLYEELIGSHPKRTDIWHVYVDREIKHGNLAQARSLFQRMTSSSKVSTRNMKAIFKKFLNFELQHGTKQSQDAVKEAARAYVERLA